MSDHVTTTTAADGSVLMIHLDDGKANALSRSIIAAVRDAVAAAESDDAIGAIVLTGRPGRFSGGFDLSVMGGGDLGAVVELVADGGDLVRTLYGCGVPVVAACTGHAVAAGALMLLGSDVRIGVDGDFKIGLNEVAIGLTLPDWGLTIAEDRLSKRHLQRAIANARLTGPVEAADAGFLDRVVSADELLDVAIAEAATLSATLDPGAYGRTMTGFRRPTLDKMAEQIAADRALAP
ncbi:MAG: crotonase/enoyl-CoA hydratase family protein [Actinomycetota bacterium]